MNRTGSIAIARSVFGGRGALIALTVALVLLASAAAHATYAHLAAALVFGLCMVGVRMLARFDASVLGTPWVCIIHLTDWLSLLLLAGATFGPLVIVALGGHPGWDAPVLAGALAIWWVALDGLIADYRRIRLALLWIAIAWMPLLVLHPSVSQIAHALAGLVAIGLAFSAWTLRRVMAGVPAHYRVVKVSLTDASSE